LKCFDINFKKGWSWSIGWRNLFCSPGWHNKQPTGAAGKNKSNAQELTHSSQDITPNKLEFKCDMNRTRKYFLSMLRFEHGSLRLNDRCIGHLWHTATLFDVNVSISDISHLSGWPLKRTKQVLTPAGVYYQ
jgi:hypothetical protein